MTAMCGRKRRSGIVEVGASEFGCLVRLVFQVPGLDLECAVDLHSLVRALEAPTGARQC